MKRLLLLAAAALALAACGDAGTQGSSSGSSSGGSGSGSSGNTGGSASPAAEPFVAEPGKWTWIDVAGSMCADGSPTGVGVHLNPDSPDVLVFLQGGGACWDGLSCWGPVETSFYVATGYGKLEWDTDVQRPLMLPLQTSNDSNPFRDANIVYIPYCTGDVHVGDADVTYDLLGTKHPTHHHGYKNVGLALDRLAATIPHIRKLWLAGDSAGGFGSALNFDRTQRRFPDARVDVLDDSGQPITPAHDKWQTWQKTWNAQLPPDCPDCRTDVSAMVKFYREKYPKNRFALISYEDDSVITAFMGLFPTTFYDELDALANDMDQHWPNGKYYFLPGALHVGLATPTPGLVDFLRKFADDDASWSSHRDY